MAKPTLTAGTRVYGCSDDLIECEGGLSGEVGYYASDDDDPGCLLIFSDGTVLVAKYGKPQGGIWAFTVVREGALFERLDVCTDEDADPYSDQVFFRPGLAWAFRAKHWERVS